MEARANLLTAQRSFVQERGYEKLVCRSKAGDKLEAIGDSQAALRLDLDYSAKCMLLGLVTWSQIDLVDGALTTSAHRGSRHWDNYGHLRLLSLAPPNRLDTP